MTNDRDMSLHDRIPPSSIAAEMALLGAAMVDRDCLMLAAEIVRPEQFYASLHASVFGVMLDLNTAGRPIDKISVAEELRHRGMLEKIGGMAYLSSLLDAVPTLASTEYYAKIVREKAVLRGLIHAGSRITQLGYEGEDDATASVAEAEMALSRAVCSGVAVKPLEAPAAAFDRIVADMRSGNREHVVNTPWATVNYRTGGFRGGELVAIPAAPMIGKTGVVLCIAEYAASLPHKGGVLLASLEMGVDPMQRRRIAQRSNVSARAQRLGRLSVTEHQQIDLAVRSLRPAPLFVVGEECNTVAGLWRAARDVVRQVGRLQVVIVDQMGWIDDVNRDVRGTTRHDRKSAAFLGLINLGREFDCPVIAVDHLNRSGNEGRPSFATLSKIRDGGNIEGHAHHVLFPYRPDPIENPTVAEIIIAKTRDGEPGAIRMHFDGARALWLEADQNGDPIRPWFDMQQSAFANERIVDDYSDLDGPSPFDISA
jgi:replicative DNA helicase